MKDKETLAVLVELGGNIQLLSALQTKTLKYLVEKEARAGSVRKLRDDLKSLDADQAAEFAARIDQMEIDGDAASAANLKLFGDAIARQEMVNDRLAALLDELRKSLEE